MSKLVLVDLEELGDMIENRLRVVVDSSLMFKASPQKQSDDQMLTRQETVDYLRICSTKLWQLERKGVVKGSRIGRAVFYKKSDLDRLRGMAS